VAPTGIRLQMMGLNRTGAKNHPRKHEEKEMSLPPKGTEMRMSFGHLGKDLQFILLTFKHFFIKFMSTVKTI
jgi:hypothetical protein